MLLPPSSVEEFKSLKSRMNTPEFREFLADMANEDKIKDERRYNESTFFLLQIHSKALLLEVYLAIADMFDAYPDMAAVEPEWRIIFDTDNSINLKFVLNIKESSDAGTFPSGYEEAPDSFADTEAFDFAISAGERVQVEHWNEFSGYDLVRIPHINNKTNGADSSFKSKDAVLKQMYKDLPEFISRVQEWALKQELKIPLDVLKRSPKSVM